MNVTTETQLVLFAAAVTALSAIAKHSPPNPEAVAAAGFLASEFMPSFEQLWSYSVENGLPKPDAASYAAMVASCQRFTETAAAAGEVQH